MLEQLSKHVFFPLSEIKQGAHRAKYLSELSASQWQNRDLLLEKQWKCLRSIVQYAYQRCPFYRERFASFGLDGALRDWEHFKSLPLLTKKDIRENTDALLSREFRREDLVEARTGGSTGVALQVYFDFHCQQVRNAAAMHTDRWSGWDIGMQVAAIWGNPPVADTLKKKLRNLLLDRVIYLDTMDMHEDSVRRFIEQWRRSNPRMIFGHSHSIFMLARYLQDMEIYDLRPKGIVSTSMMLLAPERALIEQVFGVKVTNRYGCEEVGLIACECERHAGLHLNVNHVVVEFLRDDGSDADVGEDANIVVTDLVNRGMPLIRYRVGDMGVPSDRVCSCGRGYPLMERVTGRQADFLKRPDGSLVAGVSLVERTLTAIPGIEQMQLVQDKRCHVRVMVVKGDRFTEASRRELLREFKAAFGKEVIIELQFVASLDQTQSGKYRFAICNV